MLAILVWPSHAGITPSMPAACSGRKPAAVRAADGDRLSLPESGTRCFAVIQCLSNFTHGSSVQRISASALLQDSSRS